jgi:hypothetical protein
MNSESRVIRPYAGVERLQHCLDEVGLAVGGEEIDASGQRILTAEKYISLPVSVVLADDEKELAALRLGISDGLDELELDPTAVALVLIVYSTRLKRADVVLHHSAAKLDELPERVPIPSGIDRPPGLRAPFGGCRIELYLCLAQQLEHTALKPWRLGTWLARATFDLRTDLGEFGFTPRPLTPQLRDEFGLPEKSNRYVSVDSPTLPGVGEDAVGLYVDEELLGQIAEFENTPGSIALQRQLFLDALTAIVVESTRESDFTEKSIDELEDSLCGRVVHLVAGVGAKDGAELRRAKEEAALDMLRENSARFLALLEAECDTKTSWILAAKGEPG